MKKPTLSEVRIRTKLCPGDIGYITYMHGVLYSEEFKFGIGFEAYVAAGLAEFQKNYDPTRSRVWMCEYKNRIVGALVLVDRGSSAQLRYFIIDPVCRGIGLGKKLMKLFMNFVHKCGYPHVYLLTTDGLPASAHLYTSQGFKLTEEKPGSPIFGRPVQEQRYDLDVVYRKVMQGK
jgi:N-acetylglutamate synthase-like GNAT family acetyltransferase